jgi:glycine hydroxymethyltransferase
LQAQLVRNAKALADGLVSRGLQLAYGGTDTHLLLLDVGAIPTTTGYPLRGEMAVRILDLAGIVANKNTIPGDDVTALATGVRLGTPWGTQRGLKESDMDILAELINDIVSNIQPFQYTTSTLAIPILISRQPPKSGHLMTRQ